MSKIVDFAGSRDQMRKRRGFRLDPVIADVTFALLSCQGAAHRDAVADLVIARRRSGAIARPPVTRQQIFKAFDAYMSAVATRGLPSLLHRPFGADSYRWALTPLGLQLLQEELVAQSAFS